MVVQKSTVDVYKCIWHIKTSMNAVIPNRVGDPPDAGLNILFSFDEADKN